MSAAPSEPRVYRLRDLCRVLQLSRTTLNRQRRLGVFPIPELPALDHHPRWSVDAVEAFLASRVAHVRQSRRLRVVGKGQTL